MFYFGVLDLCLFFCCSVVLIQEVGFTLCELTPGMRCVRVCKYAV